MDHTLQAGGDQWYNLNF